MSLGVLNNLPAMFASYNLNNTQNSLTKTLQQLSSGSKINSGADDAAGLSLVSGLAANAAALQQSTVNATEGVGLLQVVDGALSQVTSLLNRAVTLATQASTGTLNTDQLNAADQEYQSIIAEINNIGSTTTYNGVAVFGSDFDVYTGDSTSVGSTTVTLHIDPLADATIGDTGMTITAGTGTITATTGTQGDISGTSLTGADVATANTNAQAALTAIHDAILAVAAQDGYIGSQINTLNAISNVEATQQQNIVSAQNAVQATDYATATSNLAKYEILTQTGISALAQANSTQQMVTKLLQ